MANMTTPRTTRCIDCGFQNHPGERGCRACGALLLTSLMPVQGDDLGEVELPRASAYRPSHIARTSRPQREVLDASLATSFPRGGAQLVIGLGALQLVCAPAVLGLDAVASRFGGDPALTSASLVLTGIAMIALGVLALRGSSVAMAAAVGIWILDAVTTMVVAGGQVGGIWVVAKLLLTAAMLRTLLGMGLTIAPPTGRARVPALAAAIVTGVFVVASLGVLAPRMRAAATLGVSEESPLGRVANVERRLAALGLQRTSADGAAERVWHGSGGTVVAVRGDGLGGTRSIEAQLAGSDPGLEALFTEAWRDATQSEPDFHATAGDQRAEATTASIDASWTRHGDSVAIVLHARTGSPVP